MDIVEAIRDRRAVRDYLDRPVERSAVEDLINAAIQAPSAMNLQPWAFAVMLGRTRIEECGRRAKSWLLENFQHTPFARTAESARMRQILEDKERLLFYNAPALVMVLAKSSDFQPVEDCCLAAQNLMLAARGEGLGTCWIGFARPWLNLPATKREFGLPERFEIVAPLLLGYPKQWPDPHGRIAPEVHWLG